MSVFGHQNRLPLALSAAALAVSLGLAPSRMRVSNAADAVVTPQQKQALASLQDAFTGIAESVEPSVVGLHVESGVDNKETPSVKPSQDDGSDEGDSAPPSDLNPFGDLPFQFRQFPFSQRGTPAPSPMPRTASGSGIIIQKTGNEFYILTNYHVVQGGARIKVKLSDVNEEARGTLVGKDSMTDLAVVKVRLTGPQTERRVAKFGNSDNVKVGQWAIAIGNPLDVGQTLTVGVVSARDRAIGRIGSGVADYSGMIQTDASINPGNSGGALVDINGNIVGINTAIASPSRGSIGIGFAIPSNTARDIADKIIKNGEVVRGWLGVQTSEDNQEISPAIAKAFGVKDGAFVDEVVPNSPASKAGIQSEDVIIQWGPTPVHTFKELSAAVGVTPPGQDVPVKVIRNRAEKTVTVHTEKRADEESLQKSLYGNGGNDNSDDSAAPAKPVKANGVSVRALTPAERKAVGVAGVMVVDVEAATAAADAKIAPGMVIHRVNQTPVNSPAEFKSAMTSVKASDAYVVRMSIPTSGASWTRRTLAVTPEQ